MRPPAERLEELKAEILARHPDRRVEIRALDVNDHDQVFEVFHAFHADFGHLDRIVVNAGLGKGAPIGTGKFYANKETARDELHRRPGADRGRRGDLPQAERRPLRDGLLGLGAARDGRNITAYAATKAGVANLAEGVRAELLGTPMKVTVLYPGYIESEMSVRSAKTPLMATTEDGVRSMVRAIEKEKASARVPPWPWVRSAWC